MRIYSVYAYILTGYRSPGFEEKLNGNALITHECLKLLDLPIESPSVVSVYRVEKEIDMYQRSYVKSFIPQVTT